MFLKSRLFLVAAWAYVIIIGGLLITPRGPLCIACGVVGSIGEGIGRPTVTVLGVVAVLIGVAGLVSSLGAERTRAAL